MWFGKRFKLQSKNNFKQKKKIKKKSKISKWSHSEGPVFNSWCDRWRRRNLNQTFDPSWGKGCLCLCSNPFDNFLYNLTIMCLSGYQLTLQSGNMSTGAGGCRPYGQWEEEQVQSDTQCAPLFDSRFKKNFNVGFQPTWSLGRVSEPRPSPNLY